MGSTFSQFCMRCCCCCCAVEEDEDNDEKQPLLPPDPLEYFDREVQKRRDQETNLWSEPGDPSHSERPDDRALYGLLQARGKTRMGSTRFRRLSVDIEALRDTRREVRDKWKTILENLGFMAEADSLLTVSASASSSDRMRNAAAARTMLQTLSSETSLFESREPPPERYLFILDRLIYLDVADDFLAKARRFYPPRDSDEEEEGTGLSINLPLLLARVEAGMKRGADGDDEDDEESEREC